MLVKQAANVLDVLEFFAERRSAASMLEIARHFGWPRSSTFNIVTTLAERGYLYEPGGRGSFYPTPRWLLLAQEIEAAEPLPDALHTLMEELAAATGETVVAAAASGQHAVFVAVIESPHAIRYAAQVGKRVPIHATASGLALLCQMSERRRGALLRKAAWARYGSGTWPDARAVEAEIAAGCHRGWFQSASSFSVDLGGVSVPLAVDDRALAVTVAGPLYRMEGRWEEIAERMRQGTLAHFCGAPRRAGPDPERRAARSSTRR